MALFGKADDSLPYLTRFYQVSVKTTDGNDLQSSELAAFCRAEMLKTASAQMRDFYAINPPQPTEQQLEALAALHRQIVPLMDALADGTRLPVHFLKEIEQRLDEFARWRETFFIFPTDDDAQGLIAFADLPENAGSKVRFLTPLLASYRDDYEVPVNGLTIRPVQHGGSYLINDILTELYSLLSANSIENPSPVQRCEECKSSFVVQRRGQKFCSRRCSGRVSTRRQRQK